MYWGWRRNWWRWGYNGHDASCGKVEICGASVEHNYIGPVGEGHIACVEFYHLVVEGVDWVGGCFLEKGKVLRVVANQRQTVSQSVLI